MVDIVLSESMAEKFGKQIEAAGGGRVRLIPVGASIPEAAKIAKAEIAISGLLWGSYPFNELLEQMPGLRWIHSTGAGVDEFISPELEQRDIWLTNSSGVYAPAMVEYVIAMLVSTLRDFAGWRQAQKEHRWAAYSPTEDIELHGKRIGIIGYGGIGRGLAKACHALGMKVWAAGPHRPESPALEPLERFVELTELAELLGACDFLVISAPLNSQTRGMIGRKQFEQMKTGAVLVNVARGPIVDTPALIQALEAGKLRIAILDVTHEEPLPENDPLWDAPNAIITPHASGDAPEGWQRSFDILCANLPLYLAGKPEQMKNLVEYQKLL